MDTNSDVPIANAPTASAKIHKRRVLASTPDATLSRSILYFIA